MSRRSRWVPSLCSECGERIGVVSLRAGTYPTGRIVGWACGDCADAVMAQARKLAASGLCAAAMLEAAGARVAAVACGLRRSRT